jgi:proline iminopeptidase
MLRRIAKWTGLAAVAGLGAVMIVVLMPIRPTVPALQPRESTEYWTLDGGYRIAYTRVPSTIEPVGSPVLFLHGGPGGYVHSSTIDVLGRLSRLGRDVYLYDQSGTGLSDRRRPKATTFDSHVRDLYEIVDSHLQATKVVLIGHSYGGEIATHFASRYPERVEKLVLSSPAVLEPTIFDADGAWVNVNTYPVPEDLQFIDVAQSLAEDTGLRRLPPRAIASIALAFVADVKLASDAELDAALNTMAAGFTHNMVCDPANVRPEEGGGGAYSRTSANWYPDDLHDPRPGMRAFQAPVLVIQGQCDYIPYAATAEYVDLFPNAAYHFIEGAGHTLWWDRPDAYEHAIAEFLAGGADVEESAVGQTASENG